MKKTIDGKIMLKVTTHKKSRSEESLRWLVNLTSRGFNLTSCKLDWTKINFFHLRFHEASIGKVEQLVKFQNSSTMAE